MIVVAFDVGDKRIGIAASDPVLHLAHPVETYFRVSTERDLQYLVQVAEERGANRIVCGLPLNADGTESEQTRKTREFVELLEAKTPLPVFLEDERFTTMEARRILIDADVSRGKRKKVIDSIAASYILESYIGKLKSKGELL